MLTGLRRIDRIPGARAPTRVVRLARDCFAAILCFAPIAAAWPCSVILNPVEYPFDENQYLFYGEVRGYVPGPEVCGLEGCGPSWGLELRVAEAVHPETLRRQTVHLFLPSLCLPSEPEPRERFVARWPVGAKFKISAWPPSSESALQSSGDALVLETSWYAAVVRLPDDTSVRSEAASERDYGLVRADRGDDPFELRKDLVRLERVAESPPDAARILSRLAYYRSRYPVDGIGWGGPPGSRVQFSGLVADYDLPRELARSVLTDEWEAEVLTRGIVPVDEREFEELLELAVEGREWAQLLTGLSYLDEQRYADALFWFDLADRGGLPVAQVFSAVTYREMANELGDPDEDAADGRVTLRGRALSGADEAFARAVTTARRLVDAGEAMGSVMVAALYTAGLDEAALPDPQLFERHVCAGSQLAPLWRERISAGTASLWGYSPRGVDRFRTFPVTC